MLETIGSAGLKFAGALASRRFTEWRRRRSVKKAYAAAAEAAIEWCAENGDPPNSPVWNELVDILGSEDRAEELATIFRRGRIEDPSTFGLGNADPRTFECMRFFIDDLNGRLRKLLPIDWQIATDLIQLQMTNREAAWRGDAPSISGTEPDPSAVALPADIYVPFRRNPTFVGREQVLDDLRTAFRSGQPTGHAQVLHGLGGVGKTQIAAEYVYRFAGEYRFVWWVRAADAVTLYEDLIALAERISIPVQGLGIEDVLVSIQRRLERGSDWLVIFDNAPGPEAIEAVLPATSAGHALVTSRNPNWRRLAQTHEIPEFTSEESKAFITKRTGLEHVEGASSLASVLGNLPLALEQAAAYIERTSINLPAYIELFRTRRQALWATERPPDHYDAAVATTWSISMDRVRESTPLAADILSICAYLAPDAIPRDLLTSALIQELIEHRGDTVDELAFNDALATLRQYSLIASDPTTLSIHRLVQAVVRDRLSTDGQALWATAAAHALHRVFPSHSDQIGAWPICGALVAHVEHVIQHAINLNNCSIFGAELALGLANYLRSRARYESAIKIGKVAILWCRIVFGAGSEALGTAFDRYGSALDGYGDYTAAEDALWRAVAIKTMSVGVMNRSTAGSIANLAGAISHFDTVASLQYFEKALEIYQECLGPDDPMVGLVLGNIGFALRRIGRLNEARQYLEQALHINMYLENYVDAQQAFERAGAIFEAKLGQHHTRTVDAQQRLRTARDGSRKS